MQRGDNQYVEEGGVGTIIFLQHWKKRKQRMRNWKTKFRQIEKYKKVEKRLLVVGWDLDGGRRCIGSGLRGMARAEAERREERRGWSCLLATSVGGGKEVERRGSCAVEEEEETRRGRTKGMEDENEMEEEGDAITLSDNLLTEYRQQAPRKRKNYIPTAYVVVTWITS